MVRREPRPKQTGVVGAGFVCMCVCVLGLGLPGIATGDLRIFISGMLSAEGRVRKTGWGGIWKVLG